MATESVSGTQELNERELNKQELEAQKLENQELTIQKLEKWVSAFFTEQGLPVPVWEPLRGDAGFRQYYRLTMSLSDGEAQSTYPNMLAVNAPPETEKNELFVGIAAFLRANGLNAPRVFAKDYVQGFMLVEDLGQQALLDNLSDQTADKLYTQCFQSLCDLHAVPEVPEEFGVYSREQLLGEMTLFDQWFIPKLLSYELSADESQLIADTYEVLCQSALSQPSVFVLRDFHARNIMVDPNKSDDEALGWIDFQDGVLGPITYDLVSLLRDCYIVWPQGQVQKWAHDYYHRLVEKGLLTTETFETFERWFDLMGLQRHIKVLGIFARLSLRDQKHGYLKDLPLVVGYTRYVLAKYPELSAFSEWFDAKLLPLIQNADWFDSVDVHL